MLLIAPLLLLLIFTLEEIFGKIERPLSWEGNWWIGPVNALFPQADEEVRFRLELGLLSFWFPGW